MAEVWRTGGAVCGFVERSKEERRAGGERRASEAKRSGFRPRQREFTDLVARRPGLAPPRSLARLFATRATQHRCAPLPPSPSSHPPQLLHRGLPTSTSARPRPSLAPALSHTRPSAPPSTHGGHIELQHRALVWLASSERSTERADPPRRAPLPGPAPEPNTGRRPSILLLVRAAAPSLSLSCSSSPSHPRPTCPPRRASSSRAQASPAPSAPTGSLEPASTLPSSSAHRPCAPAARTST